MVEEAGPGIWVVRAGAIVSNSYILDAGDGQAVLVDTGMDAQAIEQALASLGRRPIAIYSTHGHFDHVGSAHHFVERYDIKAHLPRADLRIARTNNALLMLMGRHERISMPSFVAVDDGFAATVGDVMLTYHHTPGHTPGSAMLSWGGALFTGDTLYARGMGLASRPNEDLAEMRRSLQRMWPTICTHDVHPGHGPSGEGAIVVRTNTSLLAFMAQGNGPA